MRHSFDTVMKGVLAWGHHSASEKKKKKKKKYGAQINLIKKEQLTFSRCGAGSLKRVPGEHTAES